MKYILLFLILWAVQGCRSSHDEVDDEYSRGFFNALAICEHRDSTFINKGYFDPYKFPYWEENKRSYLTKVDLYNYWDTSYLKNRYRK